MLFRPPREIRDMIYAYAIGGHEVTPARLSLYDPPSKISLVASVYGEASGGENTWQSLFALSMVCHELRVETKLLPYMLNRFCYVSIVMFDHFMLMLKPQFKNAIRILFVGIRSSFNPLNPRMELVLANCKNLRTIIVRPEMRSERMQFILNFAQEKSIKLIVEEEPLNRQLIAKMMFHKFMTESVINI